jgi:hypothetical protein
VGLVPALLALAGPVVSSWLGQSRSRAVTVATLMVGNLVGGTVVTLPLLPMSTVNALRPVSYDLAEQIGWPQLVDSVETAQRSASVDPDPNCDHHLELR